jgi:hypothetical protein
MLVLLIAIFISLAAVSPPSADSHPLAKADEGFVQCYEPNDLAKTCRSIAAYKNDGDGIWDNIAVVLLAPTQPITLETVTPVRVKNGAVCGYIRNDDILKGKLRISGQLIPDEKAASILGKVAVGMAPLMHKEICTEYVQRPNGLIAKARIEGGTPEIPDQGVKWVLPSDGYRVAPNVTANAAGG